MWLQSAINTNNLMRNMLNNAISADAKSRAAELRRYAKKGMNLFQINSDIIIKADSAIPVELKKQALSWQEQIVTTQPVAKPLDRSNGLRLFCCYEF
ncbi:MAG: hypothetical protein D3903_19075 [Candidatus Electrothrix sp. GM3_4]|nr:hypothetical protein [Candidatus Electrothrix sp. GM3_4]